MVLTAKCNFKIQARNWLMKVVKSQQMSQFKQLQSIQRAIKMGPLCPFSMRMHRKSQSKEWASRKRLWGNKISLQWMLPMQVFRILFFKEKKKEVISKWNFEFQWFIFIGDLKVTASCLSACTIQKGHAKKCKWSTLAKIRSQLITISENVANIHCLLCGEKIIFPAHHSLLKCQQNAEMCWELLSPDILRALVAFPARNSFSIPTKKEYFWNEITIAGGDF